MKQYQDFVGIIAESIKQNWDLDALTDYQGATLQYRTWPVKSRNSTFFLKMQA